MQKKYFVVGIMLMFSVIALSGCEEIYQNDDVYVSGNMGTVLVTGDTDKIEIINLSVFTDHFIASGSYNRVGDGMVDFEGKGRYIINGTAKNIAGKILGHFTINFKFYDSSNNHIDSKQIAHLGSLPNSYTWDFEYVYLKWEGYSQYVDHFSIFIETY